MILEFILGLIVGFISGVSGIGGAPFLILGLSVIGLSQHAAQGTVLAVMLAPLTIFSVIHLWEYVKQYLKYIFISIITYMFFSYIGAYFAYMFNYKDLSIFFSLFIITVGLYSVIKSIKYSNKVYITRKSKITILSFIILSIFAGLLGGFFGIGAGIIIVPFLINFYNIDKNEARAISLAILLPPVSIGAVIFYEYNNDIIWNSAFIILLGYLISNFYGAKFGSKINDKTFTLILSSVLIISGMLNIFKEIQ